MNFYFDTNNLIVQADGDGGDTAQRIGMYYALIWVWTNVLKSGSIASFPFGTYLDFYKALIRLEVEPGIFVRHPTQWNEPEDFSRDQQTPLVIAMGMWGPSQILLRLKDTQEKRFLRRYQNADYPSPEHWNYFERALNNKKSYWFGDSFMFLNSCLVCRDARNPDRVDINNHLLALVQAKLFMPTSNSKAAISYMKKNYPATKGTTELGVNNHILGAIAWYHRPESGGNTGFVDLWTPVIDWLFRD